MLFMQPGTNVLEFKLASDYNNLCYFSLASALGLRYYYQICLPTSENTNPITGNYIVDADQLERNIRNMLSDGK
jgi:hypothetical protein